MARAARSLEKKGKKVRKKTISAQELNIMIS